MSILQKLTGSLFKSPTSSSNTEFLYDSSYTSPPPMGNTTQVTVSAQVYPIDVKEIPSIINWPAQTLYCLAAINIPIGFKKSSDPSAYTLEISIDQHSIYLFENPEEHDVIVHIVDSLGKLSPIASKSIVNKICLRGEFLFNAVVSGFKPITKVEKSTTDDATISGDGALVSDIVLGYTGLGVDSYTTNHTISIDIGIEFVTDNVGQKILNDPSDPNSQKLFDSTLNGLDEHVLFVPFTLIITPNIEE